MTTPSEEKPSRYLLIFRDDTEADELDEMDNQALFEAWIAWVEKLTEQEIYLSGEPLLPTGKTLRGPSGSELTDGPFVESKEIVSGFFLIQADDLEAACTIARDCPGYEAGVSVEVRPIMELGID